MATFRPQPHPELLPFASQATGIDYNKPMKADEASSVDQDNDFSDISYHKNIDIPLGSLKANATTIPSLQLPHFPIQVNEYTPDREKGWTLPPGQWMDKRKTLGDHPVTEPSVARPLTGTQPLTVKMTQAIEARTIPFDGVLYIKWSAFFIALEYTFFLACQLLSWFFLETVIETTHWGLGLGLLGAYLIFGGLMVLWCERRWIFPIKVLESLSYCVLICWGVVYLDFSIMSLSYMVVGTTIIMWAFVG